MLNGWPVTKLIALISSYNGLVGAQPSERLINGIACRQAPTGFMLRPLTELRTIATMPLFPEEDQNSHYFSRHDENNLLGSADHHPFTLDDKEWPTVEHYYQANLYKSETDQEQIRTLEKAKDAIALTEGFFSKLKWTGKHSDWKKRRQVLMTRAFYTQCKTYPNIAEALLETGDQKLVESSAYDHFWGCGRDRRGENTYGKVLMNVRAKLLEESKS